MTRTSSLISTVTSLSESPGKSAKTTTLSFCCATSMAGAHTAVLRSASRPEVDCPNARFRSSCILRIRENGFIKELNGSDHKEGRADELLRRAKEPCCCWPLCSPLEAVGVEVVCVVDGWLVFCAGINLPPYCEFGRRMNRQTRKMSSIEAAR